MSSNKLYKSVFSKNKDLPFLEARFVKNSEYHYHTHFHETLSIGAIESGQVAVVHQKKEYVLKPKELIIINPNVEHSCNPIKNEARTYYMIYLDTLWCKSIQEVMFGKLEAFLPLSELNIKDEEFFIEFVKLNKLLLDRRVLFLEKEKILQDFLLKLFSKYCLKTPKENYEFIKNLDITQKAKRYIKDNVTKNITVKEISDYLNISEFYFFKLFKQTSCISPHAYLLNQKILKAKELLSQNKDIVNIAYELGFSDQSHFNRVFKKYVAATPYEYKSSILKK